MKIGLYGGMANNMYVYAKAFSAAGVDVCFIRDRSDCYPISQPVWEDLEFRISYEDVRNAGDWNVNRLTELEEKLHWQAPQWLHDPLEEIVSDTVETSPRGLSFFDRRWARRYAAAGHRPGVISLMQQCDALMVCGIEGCILANASGMPYIIWPHGGDMMIAAGLLQPPSRMIRERLHHRLLVRQLDAAFRNAICIVSHESTAFTNDYFGAEKYMRQFAFEFLGFPIAKRDRMSISMRRQALFQLLLEAGVEMSGERLIGFVPSRVDYEWKGQDRLLSALNRCDALVRSKLLFVFTGWGNHFAEAKRFVEDNDLGGCVVFLDSVLSKPLLYRFYMCADFVIDQFILGMFGTAALEAVSCGAPLITWLNESYDRPWGAPPVIQARTSDDLVSVVQNIAAGHIDLEAQGADLQRWMEPLHSVPSVIRDLESKLAREVRAVRS